MGQYAIKDKFKNIDMVEDITAPIFIVHGMKDTVVPHSNSIDLYRKSTFNSKN